MFFKVGRELVSENREVDVRVHKIRNIRSARARVSRVAVEGSVKEDIVS